MEISALVLAICIDQVFAVVSITLHSAEVFLPSRVTHERKTSLGILSVRDGVSVCFSRRSHFLEWHFGLPKLPFKPACKSQKRSLPLCNQ